MSDWKEIYVDQYHPLWNSIFSKAIKDPNMQYDKDKLNKLMIITLKKDNIKYKIDIKYQDENQSSISVFKNIENKTTEVCTLSSVG